MSTTDLIALAAVVAGIVGWIFTYSSRKSLAKIQGEIQQQLNGLQEEFAAARERRSYLVPLHLQELQSVSAWIDEGFRIGQEFVELNEHEALSDTDWWKEQCDAAEKALEKWQKTYIQNRSIILRFEPAANEYRPTPRDLGEAFSTLGQLIDKPLLAPLAEEMVAMVNRLHSEFDSPVDLLKAKEYLKALYLSATSVFTRLRQDITDS